MHYTSARFELEDDFFKGEPMKILLHFLPGKMHHAAQAKGEVVLELHGMGPFDIHYLNPADDPRKATAAK
jgi:hypothetical protein